MGNGRNTLQSTNLAAGFVVDRYGRVARVTRREPQWQAQSAVFRESWPALARAPEPRRSIGGLNVLGGCIMVFSALVGAFAVLADDGALGWSFAAGVFAAGFFVLGVFLATLPRRGR